MFIVYRNRYNVTNEILSVVYKHKLLSHLGGHDYLWHIDSNYNNEIFVNDTSLVLPTSLTVADQISYFVFDYDNKDSYSYTAAMDKESTIYESTTIKQNDLLEKMIELEILV